METVLEEEDKDEDDSNRSSSSSSSNNNSNNNNTPPTNLYPWTSVPIFIENVRHYQRANERRIRQLVQQCRRSRSSSSSFPSSSLLLPVDTVVYPWTPPGVGVVGDNGDGGDVDRGGGGELIETVVSEPPLPPPQQPHVVSKEDLSWKNDTVIRERTNEQQNRDEKVEREEGEREIERVSEFSGTGTGTGTATAATTTTTGTGTATDYSSHDNTTTTMHPYTETNNKKKNNIHKEDEGARRPPTQTSIRAPDSVPSVTITGDDGDITATKTRVTTVTPQPQTMDHGGEVGVREVGEIHIETETKSDHFRFDKSADGNTDCKYPWFEGLSVEMEVENNNINNSYNRKYINDGGWDGTETAVITTVERVGESPTPRKIKIKTKTEMTEDTNNDGEDVTNPTTIATSVLRPVVTSSASKTSLYDRKGQQQQQQQQHQQRCGRDGVYGEAFPWKNETLIVEGMTKQQDHNEVKDLAEEEEKVRRGEVENFSEATLLALPGSGIDNGTATTYPWISADMGKETETKLLTVTKNVDEPQQPIPTKREQGNGSDGDGGDDSSTTLKNTVPSVVRPVVASSDRVMIIANKKTATNNEGRRNKTETITMGMEVKPLLVNHTTGTTCAIDGVGGSITEVGNNKKKYEERVGKEREEEGEDVNETNNIYKDLRERIRNRRENISKYKLESAYFTRTTGTPSFSSSSSFSSTSHASEEEQQRYKELLRLYQNDQRIGTNDHQYRSTVLVKEDGGNGECSDENETEIDEKREAVTDRQDTNQTNKQRSFYVTTKVSSPASPILSNGHHNQGITLAQLRAMQHSVSRLCPLEQWTSSPSQGHEERKLLTPSTVTLGDVDRYLLRPFVAYQRQQQQQQIQANGSIGTEEETGGGRTFIANLPSTRAISWESSRPRWYVCCEWDKGRLVDLIECLERFVQDFRYGGGGQEEENDVEWIRGGGTTEDTPLWIWALCARDLVTNGFEGENEAGEESEKTAWNATAEWAMAVAEGRIVLVLDGEGTALRRTWCLWELLLSLSLSSSFRHRGGRSDVLEKEEEDSKEESPNRKRRKRQWAVYTTFRHTYTHPYTKEQEERSAVGMIPHGGTSDLRDNRLITAREASFPHELWRKTLSIRIEDAKCSSECDRIRILDYLVGEDVEDQRSDGMSSIIRYAAYSRANRTLSGVFALSRTNLRIALLSHSSSVSERKEALGALSRSTTRDGIRLNFRDGWRGLTKGMATELVSSLPLGIRWLTIRHADGFGAGFVNALIERVNVMERLERLEVSYMRVGSTWEEEEEEVGPKAGNRLADAVVSHCAIEELVLFETDLIGPRNAGRWCQRLSEGKRWRGEGSGGRKSIDLVVCDRLAEFIRDVADMGVVVKKR